MQHDGRWHRGGARAIGSSRDMGRFWRADWGACVAGIVATSRASRKAELSLFYTGGRRLTHRPAGHRPQRLSRRTTGCRRLLLCFASPNAAVICLCSHGSCACRLLHSPLVLRVWSAVPSQKQVRSSQARLYRLVHFRCILASQPSQHFPASIASSLQLVVPTRMAQLSACSLLSSQSDRSSSIPAGIKRCPCVLRAQASQKPNSNEDVGLG